MAARRPICSICKDAIVGRIARMLDVRIVAAEARRAERRPTPELDGPLLSGMAWLHRGMGRENVARARPFLERALALDPGNADASAAEVIACALTVFSSDLWTASRLRPLQRPPPRGRS